MSDASLSCLARLDRRQLLAKLDQLDRQRRVVVALIRAQKPEVRRRREAAHA